MALGKNCRSKVKRGGLNKSSSFNATYEKLPRLNKSSSFNATDEKLCVLQSRKRVISSCIDAMSEISPFQTPLKKQCCTKLNTKEDSLIEALPQDILIKILCGVEHNDLKQLFRVSNKIRDATLIAKQWHFAYSTPTSKIRGVKLFDGLEESSKFDSVETPNAPRQQRFSHKSRISDQKLADLNIALFHSTEEVQPWSSRRKRLLLETLV